MRPETVFRPFTACSALFQYPHTGASPAHDAGRPEQHQPEMNLIYRQSCGIGYFPAAENNRPLSGHTCPHERHNVPCLRSPDISLLRSHTGCPGHLRSPF